MCVEEQPASLLDGTLALLRTPSPGPVCVASAPFSTASPRQSTEDSLGFLFRQCSNPAVGLSDEDLAGAATTVASEVAVIKAIAKVESSMRAFDDAGRPTILFERHYFHRLTGGRYDATHPNISNSTSGGYGRFSEQYGKLEEAYRLDPDAALRSASWGRFQIMGNNYRAAGFASARQFVQAMTRSEREQLQAFVNFVASDKAMLAALQRKDWAAFAKAYNGPCYAANAYDTKLKAAYDEFAGQSAPAPNTNSPSPPPARLP